jgi:hypothetical protein
MTIFTDFITGNKISKYDNNIELDKDYRTSKILHSIPFVAFLFSSILLVGSAETTSTNEHNF